MGAQLSITDFNRIIRQERYNILSLKPCLDPHRNMTANSSPEREYDGRSRSRGFPSAKQESQRPTAASERFLSRDSHVKSSKHALTDNGYHARQLSRDLIADTPHTVTFFERNVFGGDLVSPTELGTSGIKYPFENAPGIPVQDEIVVHPYETLGKERMRYPRFPPVFGKAIPAKLLAESIELDLQFEKRSELSSKAASTRDSDSRQGQFITDKLSKLEEKAGVLSNSHSVEFYDSQVGSSQRFYKVCNPGRSEPKKVYDCKINCHLYENPADSYIPTHCSLHCACKQPGVDTRKYHELNSTRPLGSVSYQLHQQKCLSHSENLDEPLSNPYALRNKQNISQGPDAETLLQSSLSATLLRLGFWRGRIKSISSSLLSKLDFSLSQIMDSLIGQTSGEPLVPKSLFGQLLHIIGFRLSDKIQNGLTRDTLFQMIDKDQDSHFGLDDFKQMFGQETKDNSLSSAHKSRVRSVSSKTFTSDNGAPTNYRELPAESRIRLAELFVAWAEFAELTRLLKQTLVQYYSAKGKSIQLVPRTQICLFLQDIVSKHQDSTGDCGHEGKHHTWEDPSRPQFLSSKDVGFLVDNLLLLIN